MPRKGSGMPVLDPWMLAADRGTVLSRNAVSRETVERLDAYSALLLRWQTSINLVAPSTLPAIWTRHLEEGLFLDRLIARSSFVVDLGSGGGLPGLVLALCRSEGDGPVELVESNGKKAAFLRTVIRELGLRATVHAERIEEAGSVLAKADAVTARALASLDTLCGFVVPLIRSDAICWFPKGRGSDEEIAEASAHWRFDMVKHPSPVTPDSVVLELSGLRPRSA